MNEKNVTKHARARMQQRGITSEILEGLFDYCDVRFQGDGTVLVYVPRRYVGKFDIPHRIAEKILDVGIVEALDSTVITAKRLYRRLFNKRGKTIR